MSAATQIFSRDFDSAFYKLPKSVQDRIETQINRLGSMLNDFPHQRLTGMTSFKLRVGDYRVIYKFHLERGELYLLNVGHRAEVYRL